MKRLLLSILSIAILAALVFTLAGCKKEDIYVVFALGSHRPHTEEEKIKLVGERVYNEVRCIDSDPSDCIHMGDTSRGTPVDMIS